VAPTPTGLSEVSLASVTGPAHSATVTLTNSTSFNWLHIDDTLVVYPRTSTAVLLNAWGVVETKV